MFYFHLQLDQALVYNQFVAPVNLPPAGFDPPAGTVTTVSGWGTTSVSRIQFRMTNNDHNNNNS